jgi:hypothetical protein
MQDISLRHIVIGYGRPEWGAQVERRTAQSSLARGLRPHSANNTTTTPRPQTSPSYNPRSPVHLPPACLRLCRLTSAHCCRPASPCPPPSSPPGPRDSPQSYLAQHVALWWNQVRAAEARASVRRPLLVMQRCTVPHDTN